jgi:hypothetical protein
MTEFLKVFINGDNFSAAICLSASSLQTVFKVLSVVPLAGEDNRFVNDWEYGKH